MFRSIRGLLAVLVIATGAWAQGSIWNGTADVSWYNSSQSEFTITTAEQLAGLAQLVNGGNGMSGKTITLGNDIMLNNTANWQNWATTAPANTWTAIGTSSYSFLGTFDGAGHVVNGVYINTTSDYQGLFGYSSGPIKNLGVVASYVKGGQYVGGLAGGNYIGRITNSYSTGNVTGTSNVGGLVGTTNNSNSYIGNSYSTGNVTGTSNVGGLVGYIEWGEIGSSYSTGNVTGTSNVGGLVGYNGRGQIGSSYSTGNVSGTGSYVGGLVGRNGELVGSSGRITYSYAAGKVTGTGSYVGGLVGGNINNSTVNDPVTDCYYDSQTSGQNDTDKGTPKTTAEMKEQATYTGWDFYTFWAINPAINNGYPHHDIVVTVYWADCGVYNGVYNETKPLSITVGPDNATNKTVACSVVSGGATISGNNITFTQAGQVTIRVTVENGFGRWGDYVRDFDIEVAKAPGVFVTPPALNTTFTPTLTLADITPSANYEWWNDPTTLLWVGNNQTFYATYTDPSGNYLSEWGSITVNVAKAPAPTGVPRTETVAAGYAHTYHFDLRMLLPDIADLWPETYHPVITNNTSGVLDALSYTDGNILVIPVNNVSGAGLSATITVTVSNYNYEDFTAVITVTTVNKKLVNITGITMADGVYNGYPHGYTGTPVLIRDDNGETVTGVMLEVLYESTDGQGYSNTAAPTNAGKYRLTLKVPNSNANYTGEAEFEFTIADPTPILPSQLASGNKAVQTRNGLNLTATSNATVEIYNLSGNLVSRQNFASGVYAISLGHLPKGLYLAKVSFGSGKEVLRVPVR